jgi:hypothetical protein
MLFPLTKKILVLACYYRTFFLENEDFISSQDQYTKLIHGLGTTSQPLPKCVAKKKPLPK